MDLQIVTLNLLFARSQSLNCRKQSMKIEKLGYDQNVDACALCMSTTLSIGLKIDTYFVLDTLHDEEQYRYLQPFR